MEKIKKIGISFLVIFAFLLALVNYYEYDMMGFPDGYLSELEHTQEKYFPIFIGLNIIFSIIFIYVLIVYNQIKKSRINLLIFLFSAIFISFYVLNFYLATILNHGQGG
ncbi:hypothetical protein UMM65_01670 [Aureibaculum sp. 2210JD6-5]|uniref:hypothetical protein n=1 Tax=Aureibaculum sp. 2210JD6-5 TaxID=3103957 RepID=UPI002AAC9FF7|nr:hypothetical protein [Aureibaculum sp. 2210JD6-5]MDY7393940.1 hypothetical protein [Aureibaculum sp. 2210JD6-5]